MFSSLTKNDGFEMPKSKKKCDGCGSTRQILKSSSIDLFLCVGCRKNRLDELNLKGHKFEDDNDEDIPTAPSVNCDGCSVMLFAVGSKNSQTYYKSKQIKLNICGECYDKRGKLGLTGHLFEQRFMGKKVPKKPVVKSKGVHSGFECDNCSMSPIIGTRWKCLTKVDYDLCSRCYKSRKSFGMFNGQKYAEYEQPGVIKKVKFIAPGLIEPKKLAGRVYRPPKVLKRVPTTPSKKR